MNPPPQTPSNDDLEKLLDALESPDDRLESAGLSELEVIHHIAGILPDDQRGHVERALASAEPSLQEDVRRAKRVFDVSSPAPPPLEDPYHAPLRRFRASTIGLALLAQTQPKPPTPEGFEAGSPDCEERSDGSLRLRFTLDDRKLIGEELVLRAPRKLGPAQSEGDTEVWESKPEHVVEAFGRPYVSFGISAAERKLIDNNSEARLYRRRPPHH